MSGSNSFSQVPEKKGETPQSGTTPPVVGTTGVEAKTTPATSPSPSNYDEVYSYLKGKMAEHAPETPEQKKKRERREKWEGIISGISDAVSSVSNLYFTSQYAPNMYDPTKSMSAKAKERFDKAKAEREADSDKYYNYALTLAKAKDADDAKNYQRERDKIADQRDQRNYNFQVNQADRQADQWQKTFDRQADQWQKTFDRQADWHKEEGERWQKQFNEGVRQFNISSQREAQRIAMEGKRLALQMKQGQMSFNLGPSKGNVVLSQEQLNPQTVSRIFHTLPQEVRDKVHGTPIYTKDMFGNQVVSGYGDPTTEAMLIAIGAHVNQSPNTQDAIREVAGQKPQNKHKSNPYQ